MVLVTPLVLFPWPWRGQAARKKRINRARVPQLGHGRRPPLSPPSSALCLGWPCLVTCGLHPQEERSIQGGGVRRRQFRAEDDMMKPERRRCGFCTSSSPPGAWSLCTSSSPSAHEDRPRLFHVGGNPPDPVRQMHTGPLHTRNTETPNHDDYDFFPKLWV